MFLRSQYAASISVAASLDVAPPAAGATSRIWFGLLEDLDLVSAAHEPQTTLSGASKTPSPLNAKVAEEASLKPSRYGANIRESAQPPRRRGDHCSLVFRLGLFTEQFEGSPCLRAVQGDTVDLGLFLGFVEL